MKKKQLILSAMLIPVLSLSNVLMGTGAANAQKALQQSSGRAYTYVQQASVKLSELGTAAFDISATSQPRLSFDENGNAVMKINGNTVAKLPMKDNGQLVVEFETDLPEEELNKVTATTAGDYGTIYSPFQLEVSEGASVTAYAPTYDKDKHGLDCTSNAKIAGGSVIPCETALLLKRNESGNSAKSARSASIVGDNDGTIVYKISAAAPTVTPHSILSGSSLKTSVPELGDCESLYALDYHTEDDWFGEGWTWDDWFGEGSEWKNWFGEGWTEADWTGYDFYEYSGSSFNPGNAWLVVETVSLEDILNFIVLLFDEDQPTSITQTTPAGAQFKDGKYLKNGRVVILKNGKKYNTNGQKVK